MHSDTHTIKVLFQHNVRYVIPIFQRPYVWQQDEQWDPLWEDIRNLAEQCIEELSDVKSPNAPIEKNIRAHFLGPIVLQQIPTKATDIDRREIIDGQQRMITI